jgi:hypothetical protein
MSISCSEPSAAFIFGHRPVGIPWLYYAGDINIGSTISVFRGEHNRMRFVLVVTSLAGSLVAVEDLDVQWQVGVQSLITEMVFFL